VPVMRAVSTSSWTGRAARGGTSLDWSLMDSGPTAGPEVNQRAKNARRLFGERRSSSRPQRQPLLEMRRNDRWPIQRRGTFDYDRRGCAHLRRFAGGVRYDENMTAAGDPHYDGVDARSPGPRPERGTRQVDQCGRLQRA
jgi:hypothetical protein